MKPSHRRIICLVFCLASCLPGCGGAHDRQMVYTMPREAKVGLATSEDVARKPRRKPAKLAVPKPIPASNGIDVPMIEAR